jgi:hypothetical protein
MPDVTRMSTAFLKAHELLAYSSVDELIAEFDTWLDSECDEVELPYSEQTFTASFALRTLDPAAYAAVFKEYISEFIALDDGGYLHMNHEDEALRLAAIT